MKRNKASSSQSGVSFRRVRKRHRSGKLVNRLGKIEVKALEASKVGKLALALVKGLDGGFRTRCIFDWFYSSLDEAYFMNNEFELRLASLALQGIPLEKSQRLTRFEWAVVRQKIGCPRRFSSAFLRDERKELERYRRDVRDIQNNKDQAPKEQSFPYPVFHRLEVGMRVTALRWFTGNLELGTGLILTADYDKKEYQVQWDIPRLGVTFCPDYEVRPCSGVKVYAPAGAIQEADSIASDSRSGILDAYTGLRSTVGWIRKTSVGSAGAGIPTGFAVEEEEGNAPSAGDEEAAVGSMDKLKVMADALSILDRKEAILAEIKHMNKRAEKLGKPENLSKDFKTAYAWLLETLDSTNAALEPALHLMRETFLEKREESIPSKALDGEANPRHTLSTTQAEFADRWLESAKVLVDQLHSAQLDHSSTSTVLNTDILNKASCGISLLLAIRHSAEMYTSPSDVSLGIDAIVHRLKPRFKLNEDGFTEILSLASLIKAGCTPR